MDYLDYDTRVAAYAVLVQDGKILLALWNEGVEPLWTMPGGGVELDETVEQAVVREVFEESGYSIDLDRILGVHSNTFPGGGRLDGGLRPLKSIRVVFEGRIVGGDLRHEVDGTTDEARWIDLAQVPLLPRVPLVDSAITFWRDRG